MSKEMVKNLIDLIPESDIDTIYKVIVKFIPEEEPNEETIEAMKELENGCGECFDTLEEMWKSLED